MKIVTRAQYQWNGSHYALTLEESFEYSGPVALSKGEGTSKAQLAQQNALQEKAFNTQQAQLAQLKGAFGKYLDHDIGYSPELKAALQTQFQNSTAGQYNDASAAIRNAILARGGSGQMPLSGTDVRGILGLEASKADTLSRGTLGLNIADLEQAVNNRFQAGNLLSGNAAMLNSPISTFGAGANNALNQYVSASNSGFGASFMKSLGGSLGAGVGAVATGGLGAGLNAGATALNGGTAVNAFTPWK